MKDKQENYWHTSTASISVNHPFERRIGLWKAGFDADGELYCDQHYGDFPIDSAAPAFSRPDWMLLSYGKKVVSTGGTGAEAVTDENSHTWWTGNIGDSLTLDLGRTLDVRAVQINFADANMRVDMPDKGCLLSYWRRYIEADSGYTRWLLEGSADGVDFSVLCDKSLAMTDLPHDFLTWDLPRKLRFVRLTVKAVPYGNPCVSGLRVFGKAEGALPEPARNLILTRIGDLDLDVGWDGNAVGYAVLWGHAPDKLYHCVMAFGKTRQRIGALIHGQPLYVRVDAFNESGITEGTSVLSAYTNS
jgi:hypothetical protein